MSEHARLGLFEGVGLELEYMIVENRSLDVLPVADQVLSARAGAMVNEVEAGPLRWSNELVLHVIELKTNGPARSIGDLAGQFDQGVAEVNSLLSPLGGRLMPSAMHPWFDPASQTRIWPHGSSAIYNAYNRIFDCRGHGWANLQSAHLNLPFADDDQFGRLHAAIRLVLPLLPALAASSPVFDGRVGPALDNRLQMYRANQKGIPEIIGRIIPEAVFTAGEYRRRILEPLYRAIAPLDTDGILQEEWLNSRGAIARFERGTIEIRVLDVQECPAADIAIATLIIELLRAMVEERWAELSEQQGWSEAVLANLFARMVLKGERVVIEDAEYLGLFGFPDIQATGTELWAHLAEILLPGELAEPLQVIFEHGPLARRLLGALGRQPDRQRLAEVYGRLCDCLEQGMMFVP